MKFENLILAIEQTHSHFQHQAVKAVNISLTLRNWLVGFYILEFEQNGEDRAKYGSKLLDNLASELRIKGLVSAELSRCRQFYHCYPQILGSLTQEFKNLLPKQILGSLTQELYSLENTVFSSEASLKKPLKEHENKLSGSVIVSKLSFTHLVELIKIDNASKRTFYELECIKGTWSVRELKRQINSLYYERSGMSLKPEKLADITQIKAEKILSTEFIKSVYAFKPHSIPIK